MRGVGLRVPIAVVRYGVLYLGQKTMIAQLPQLMMQGLLVKGILLTVDAENAIAQPL